METVSPRTALARLDLSYSLLRALDRPAREALELARRPLLATVAPALLGLLLVATASTLAGFVSPDGFQLAPRLDGVRAVFESLLVVVPGTLVFASYLRLRISPRAFLAATSIGLLAAGLMAACVLPLMAFFVLVAHDDARAVLSLPALLVPALALATVVVLPARVITSLDRSRSAYWVSRAFAFFLITVFALRVNTFFVQLYIQAR